MMGSLIRLDTTLTGERYVSILSDHLHPFMSIVHSERLGEFQQDNATPHTSKVATEWLQKHTSKLTLPFAIEIPRHEHYLTILGSLAACCLEEIFTPS
ncbi:DDE_3 domain-containing protein [Trichonephila clavipes]|nr:DDE_3 domain-containing protein [Trichonephila clavipes]